MRIIEKLFTTKQHGVAGYLAMPERSQPGPALYLIHPKGGMGEYIKTETRKFAQLGYTTFAVNAFEQLGFPEETHIVTGAQIQAKTPDPEFTRVLTEGWRFLLKQPNVNKQRVAVCGYCMGGRIAIHFVASVPEEVRAFVGYYPTVRDEPASALRPIHPSAAVKKFRCPSVNLYGADDVTTVLPMQEAMYQAFKENGQPLEWHFFPFGGHGFVDPGAPGYNPRTADLSWPLVADFLERNLVWSSPEVPNPNVIV
ncbi:MAG TPA: dienelactone hydrolase family protein [Candidatus Limnocylindrales bacterium]|jgi:carboxymethylenebutenolidase|nr:dienelactone hydrolase family protein [Candidatus Limnocylindrales bacterium]